MDVEKSHVNMYKYSYKHIFFPNRPNNSKIYHILETYKRSSNKARNQNHRRSRRHCCCDVAAACSHKIHQQTTTSNNQQSSSVAPPTADRHHRHHTLAVIVATASTSRCDDGMQQPTDSSSQTANPTPARPDSTQHATRWLLKAKPSNQPTYYPLLSHPHFSTFCADDWWHCYTTHTHKYAAINHLLPYPYTRPPRTHRNTLVLPFKRSTSTE